MPTLTKIIKPSSGSEGKDEGERKLSLEEQEKSNKNSTAKSEEGKSTTAGTGESELESAKSPSDPAADPSNNTSPASMNNDTKKEAMNVNLRGHDANQVSPANQNKNLEKSVAKRAIILQKQAIIQQHQSQKQQPDILQQHYTSPKDESSVYPLTDIEDPTANDVLLGNGRAVNEHAGNKLYRQWVDAKRNEYNTCPSSKKKIVAMNIVKAWRALDPPGRFLKKDGTTKLWHDVGDAKAREKFSQAFLSSRWKQQMAIMCQPSSSQKD